MIWQDGKISRPGDKLEGAPPTLDDINAQYQKAQQIAGRVPHGRAPFGQAMSKWLQNLQQSGKAPEVLSGKPATEFKKDPSKPDNGMSSYLAAAYGDPEEDAKRERSNRQRLAITAVGDALRHLGNIYHTTKYAPAQKLSNATEDEYKRQLTADQLEEQRRLKRAQQALKQYEIDQNNYWKQANYDLAKEKGEREKEAQKWKENESKARVASIEANTGYTKAKTEDLPKQAEARERGLRIREQQVANSYKLGQARIAAARSRGGGRGGKGGSKSSGLVELEYNGDVIQVREDALNGKNIHTLFNRLKLLHGDDMSFNLDAKTPDAMWGVISQYYEDPEVIRYLEDFGAELDDYDDEDEDVEIWNPSIIRVGQGMANTLSSRFKEGIRKNMPKMQQQAAAMKKKQGGKAASGGGKAAGVKTAPKGKSRRSAAVSEFG